MPNRLLAGIFLEVPFGHIGFLVAIVHQHPVPGLILGWPGLGYLVVPFVREHELGIYVDYYAAVVEFVVVDQGA